MIIPNLFRFLFHFSFFKKRYFGIYKRIILPYKLFKNKTTIAEYDDTLKIKLNIDEWIQQQIFLFGYFDQPGINFIKKNLKKDHVFIDAGANIGAYSLVASKIVGDQGKVIAFEPVKNTFDHIQENISLNNLKNIDLNKTALGEKKERITIYSGDDSNTGNSSIIKNEASHSASEEIQCINFDEEFSDLERIDFLKIDIEGAEYYALKGMIKSLEKFKPTILIEISDEIIDKADYSKKDLIVLLTNIGYQQYGLNESGEIIPVSDQDSSYHNFVFK